MSGWPDNPSGWGVPGRVTQGVGHRPARASPSAKRDAAHVELSSRELDELDRREERWHSGVDDDRLRLIFTCCHPTLDLPARVALTLRSAAWLTTEEIAQAFGVPVPTIAQRIVRAQQRIKTAGTPYRVPVGQELPDRLAGVLRVAYLVLNEAYLSARPGEPIRVDLADEAIRLGRELTELMPDEPEAGGLLALMLVQHARADARFDARGDLVILRDQDRTTWNRALIDEGTSLLDGAMRRRSIGPYQLQAAIAALHGRAATFDGTDWPQIAALYGVLASIDPSPVISLNRAVAIGFAVGAATGLVELDVLDGAALPQPHLVPATRGELLLRLGRDDEAIAAFDEAFALVVSETERRHLMRQRAAASG